MTLINLREFPPKGYLYVEPSIKWRCPRELALQGLSAVAQALQRARAQNPEAGLNPDYTACVNAIREYTCDRLKDNPEILAKFCGDIPEELTVEKKRGRRGPKACVSCGKR